MKRNPSVMLYSPSATTLEDLTSTYNDYVTNPYSELRQRHEYFESRLSMGIGVINPLPLEKRALRYKYNPLMDNDEEVMIYNLPKPQHDATYVNFVVLLDVLYRKCYIGYNENNEDGYRPRVSAQILKEITEHYAYFLDVLESKHIISGATFSYIEIRKPEIFQRTEYKNLRVLKKIEVLRKKAFDAWQVKMTEAKEVSTDSFVDRYNQNLRHYHLDVEKAREAILRDGELKEGQRQYRLRRIESFEDGNALDFGYLDDAPDINGRWYHRVTMTPSDIRRYSNIRYSVDVKNSQLVLFNIFIISFYLSLDIDIFTTFSKYNKDTFTEAIRKFVYGKERNAFNPKHLNAIFTSDRRKVDIRHGLTLVPSEDVLSRIREMKDFREYTKAFHLIMYHIANEDMYAHTNHVYYKRIQYDSDKLCKLLRDNGFKGSILEKVRTIPTNVRRYIYQSCNGLIWDNLVARTGMSRGQVKEMVFKNIFYSYAHSRVSNKEIRDAFKREFKDVYSILTYYKVKFKDECDYYGLDRFMECEYKEGRIRAKGLITLSHKLTQIESSIFYEVLRKLFQMKGVIAVGIHDAVAILDDALAPSELIEIIKKTCKKYGVYATIKEERNNALVETV